MRLEIAPGKYADLYDSLDDLPARANHEFSKAFLASQLGEGNVRSLFQRLQELGAEIQGGDLERIRERYNNAMHAHAYAEAGFEPISLAFACLVKGVTDFSNENLQGIVDHYQEQGLTRKAMQEAAQHVKKNFVLPETSVSQAYSEISKHVQRQLSASSSGPTQTDATR